MEFCVYKEFVWVWRFFNNVTCGDRHNIRKGDLCTHRWHLTYFCWCAWTALWLQTSGLFFARCLLDTLKSKKLLCSLDLCGAFGHTYYTKCFVPSQLPYITQPRRPSHKSRTTASLIWAQPYETFMPYSGEYRFRLRDLVLLYIPIH